MKKYTLIYLLFLLCFACGEEESSNSSSNFDSTETSYVSTNTEKENTKKVETFGEKMDMIGKIRNWYVGYVWNDGIVDMDWYTQYGTNSVGEELDIDFCIRNFNKELDSNLNSYNEYIENLDPDKFSELQYSWDKMYTEIIEIQELVNVEGLRKKDKKSVIVSKASTLRQYFKSFDREIDRLEESKTENK